jgi:integrase
MVVRVERGKGGVDRELPLSQKLLETLRAHWRWLRPKTYLFPGTANGWRADKPKSSFRRWRNFTGLSRSGFASIIHSTPCEAVRGSGLSIRNSERTGFLRRGR